jgi:hypothetical protein
MDLLNQTDKISVLPDDIKRIIVTYMSHKVADIFKRFNDELNEGLDRTRYMADLNGEGKHFKKLLEGKNPTPLPTGFTGGYFRVDDTIWAQSDRVLFQSYKKAATFWLRKKNNFNYLPRSLVVIEATQARGKIYGILPIHPHCWETYTIKDYKQIAEWNGIKVKSKIRKNDLMTALLKH